MNDQENEVLIALKNNTDTKQHISLFDQNNKDSGGAFKPVQSARVIKYDLSTETFPTANPMQVIVNYNSVLVPIYEVYGYNAGDLDFSALLTYLNSLNIGPFTDEGGSIMNAKPNYALASDNGGQVGVEVEISEAGKFTATVDDQLGSFSGDFSVSNVASYFPNFVGTLAPTESAGDSNTATIIPDGSFYTVRLNGSLTADTKVYIRVNGVQKSLTPLASGTINWTSDPVLAKDGDTWTVTILDA